MQRSIPLYTLEGVPNAAVSTHHFSTEDMLGLSLLRFQKGPSDDVVLIVHGLTTSSDMYVMPEHYNLVRFLHDHGFGDVWCLDNRMSNRHSYNLLGHPYNLDDVALFDYPAALAAIRREVGDRRIHVISHCLGATTLLMSLYGRAIDGLASVIVNSAGLTLRVPAWSRAKLHIAPFLIEHVLGLPYVNPAWSSDRGLTRGKLLSKLVSLAHPECNVPACHMLSLMWGCGQPALYSHENLEEVTHRRSGDLYGAAGLHYYRHVSKIVEAGVAVKMEPRNAKYHRLPHDYLEHAADIDTPILLVTGLHNQVFADSNVVCHRILEERRPGRHQLQVVPGYGHQDVMMGRNCHEDVFPRFVEFLKAHRSTVSVPASLAATG
jgi:cholesterol oxidase